MSAKPAADRQGCERVDLPSRARGCLSGLGVASRPSQSRQPPAQALAETCSPSILEPAHRDAISRTLDRAFSAHSSRVMHDRATGYRRHNQPTIVAAPLPGSYKIQTGRPPANQHERFSLWGATSKETES